MKAVIFGAAGQDGSYLSELLLEHDYDVIAIVRRSSTDAGLWRIKHLMDKPHFYLTEGDVTDAASVNDIMWAAEGVGEPTPPHEVYNLAAQSHVWSSFNQPAYTIDTILKGTLNILEWIRRYASQVTRFFHAGSSEMFGSSYNTKYIKTEEYQKLFDIGNPHESIMQAFNKNHREEKYQDELTPFRPCSPYGCAKLAAHHLVNIYRKSYGIFACSAITFNHESVPGFSPLIIKNGNVVDILPIEDLFRTEKHRYEGILDKYKNTQVWNGEDWTKIIDGFCYKDKNKSNNLVQTRSSCYEATDDHIAFDEDNLETYTNEWKLGQKVFEVQYPELSKTNNFDSLDIVEFIGYVVGDGYISESGQIRLTGTNIQELVRIAKLLADSFNYTYNIYNAGLSEYSKNKDIYQLTINCDKEIGFWIKKHIYTNHSNYKKVPAFILNGSAEIRMAFWKGYYAADGRKAGHENYEYKGFTTNSATLCLGLLFITKDILSQTPKVKCEVRDNARYYYVQFRSKNSTKPTNNLREIIKLMKVRNSTGWFFDIQTESHTFATGPNLFKVHNSYRRGDKFVTKKISSWVAKNRLAIACDKDKPTIRLGNIETFRDWMHAKDAVRAFYMMMGQNEPKDYVISSGETQSIRFFFYKVVQSVFRGAINPEPLIEANSLEFMRPMEVNYLKGDSSLIRKELGWRPEISFDQLVNEMVSYDLHKHGKL